MTQSPKRPSISPIPPESWSTSGTWSECLDFFFSSPCSPVSSARLGKFLSGPRCHHMPIAYFLAGEKEGRGSLMIWGGEAQKTEGPQRESPRNRALYFTQGTVGDDSCWHFGGKRCRESIQEMGLKGWKNSLSQKWSLCYRSQVLHGGVAALTALPSNCSE